MKNVTIDDKFDQVIVWPGTILKEEEINDFKQFLKREAGLECQYLEQIKTLPDENGPGGRNDLFFAVNAKEIQTFAILKMSMGMRYIEDIYSNINNREGYNIYPERIKDYMIWDANYDDIDFMEEIKECKGMDRFNLYNWIYKFKVNEYRYNTDDKASRRANKFCVQNINEIFIHLNDVDSDE
jgi:hypothetical protein